MLSPWAFRSASGHIMYHCMVTKGVTVKVLVIHNLRSGLRNGAVYDFMRSYAEQGDSVTIRSFGPDTELAPLLEDAAEYDFVVASGGDGTIASVSYELRNTGIPILPFPAGTANLLALNLFEPNESHALCKLVDEALTLDFDMGEIEATDGSKLGFTIMAGCGYDELIMRNATGNKHLLGDMAIGVVLANFSKIQFDLQVADENLPRDGKLDVVVLKTENAIQLLPTLMAKVFDHTGSLAKKVGGLEIYRGREIRIDAEPAMRIEYDGEPTEVTTPIIARSLPRSVRFVVSDECYKHFSHEQ